MPFIPSDCEVQLGFELSWTVVDDVPADPDAPHPT